MNLDALVTQLETVSGLQVEVGSPAKLENLTNAPYCWITSVVEQGSSSAVVGPVRQRIEATIDLMVGARTLSELTTARNGILAALLNFQPGTGYVPMTYQSGSMEFGDPAWFYWHDQFGTAFWIDTCEQVQI